MKKWLAVALPTIGAGVAGLYAYATTLPETHTAEVVIEVPAPPSEVEARVRDWRDAACWKPDVTSVEDLGLVDGRQRFRECTWECLDIQVEEARGAYVTRIVDHPDFGGTWTWRFAEAPGGTRVTLTEEGRVPNPLFRLFVHHVFGTDANIRATAEALSTSFDPGL